MAYIQFKDGEGALKNRKSTGTGASDSPFIAIVSLEGATPDTTTGDLAAINTATTGTHTAADIIAGAVSATHMQCDVLTLPSVKGSVTTVHNGIADTATSTEVDCTGYNALIVHAVVTGAQAWTFAVQGAMTTGGTYAAAYDGGDAMSVASISTSIVVVWKGITDFVKIVATRTGSASTCVVKVQPVNIAR